jgi:multidrug transporter EmrE-like cation transporter
MTQNSQLIPILLNLFAAFVSAFGQYLYKIGSAKLGNEPIYKNFHIFGGILLFTVVMVLFLAAFKLGGRLSVTYPIYASTFIWGALIGIVWDKEPWSYGQAWGVFFVLVGIACVAAFSPK